MRGSKKKLPLPLEISLTPVSVPRTQRSSVTNGKRLFVQLRDRHSPFARRLRDVLALQVSDLGGAENCSEAEKSLARRAAMLTLQCELLEQRWGEKGGEASSKELVLYQRTANSLRRILESLGLKRRSRDVTPDLQTYLHERELNGVADE